MRACVRACVRPTRQFRALIRRQNWFGRTRQFRALIRRRNRPGQSDGRTDRFSTGEPARTDGLCIISTNARWSVCLWAVSLYVTVGIKVDISVVLKRVLKKNQISTSNCLVCLTDGQGSSYRQGRAGQGRAGRPGQGRPGQARPSQAKRPGKF